MDFTSLLPPEILGQIINMVAELEPPRPAKNELSKVLIGDAEDAELDVEDERILVGVEDRILKGELGGSIRCSHVSRYWRSTAIGLMAHSKEELGVHPEAIPTLAQRLAETHDIRVALHGSFKRRDIREAVDYMATTPRFATRIVSLGIYEHRRNALRRLWTKLLQDCQLTRLRTLAIVGNESEVVHSGDVADFPPLILPELREVIMCDCAFSFPASPHLKRLEIIARWPEFDWVNDNVLFLCELFPALSLCKDSLEFLRLDFPIFEPYHVHLKMAPDERIYLPKLRRFDFVIKVAQPPPGDDDFSYFPAVFDHLLFDMRVMRELTAMVYYHDQEAFESMPISVEAVRKAGFAPAFGLRVVAYLDLGDPIMAFAFYASPGNLSSLRDANDIINATFGERDRDREEPEETNDIGEEGQRVSDREQGTKICDDEGKRTGGGRGPLPMFYFEASYNPEALSPPQMIAELIDGLPTIGALKVHYPDVENWETAREAVTDIVPDDVSFRWIVDPIS